MSRDYLRKPSLSSPEAALHASKGGLGKNLLSFRSRITHTTTASASPEEIGKAREAVCVCSGAPPQKQESPGINYLPPAFPFELAAPVKLLH